MERVKCYQAKEALYAVEDGLALVCIYRARVKNNIQARALMRLNVALLNGNVEEAKEELLLASGQMEEENTWIK